MSDPTDYTGLTIHYSGEWTLVDVSINPFQPGKPFRLLIGTAGDLAVRGSKMKRQDVVLIPLPTGFAPLLCDEILVNAGNTADNIVALF